MSKRTQGRAHRVRATSSAAAAVIGLALGGAMLSSTAHAEICNNSNIYGVTNGPRANTYCMVGGTFHATQLITYHWNNGQGATPGAISLRNVSTGQVLGPFAAHGTSGQGGAANVNWIADVNLNIPLGTWQVFDSNPATWSQNPQSGYAGFFKAEGGYVTASPPPPPPPPPPVYVPPRPIYTPPTPPPMGQFCVRNSGSIGDTTPCTGPVRTGGVYVTLTLKRAITTPITFAQFYIPGVTSQVLSGVVGGSRGLTAGSTYIFQAPPQLCMNTGATYSIRAHAGFTSMGDVGAFRPVC
jgi:hypothetical protein